MLIYLFYESFLPVPLLFPLWIIYMKGWAEDMTAAKLGMRVFLLTDCLINRNGEDISAYPHGGFPELLDFVRTMTA